MGFSSKQIPAGGDCWPLPCGGPAGTDVSALAHSKICTQEGKMNRYRYSDFWFLLRSTFTQMNLA